MSSFINRVSKNVAHTPQLLYTTPSNSKSILIGANIANLTGATIAFHIYVTKNSVDYYIAKDLRIEAGEHIEIMKGNKLVLDNNDTISVAAVISTAQTTGVDVILSILSEVS